jgi:Na+/H+ antiporter NhaA
MTAIARALSRGFSEARLELDSLKTICLFCGIGLTVSLFLAAYGFDLSPGPF